MSPPARSRDAHATKLSFSSWRSAAFDEFKTVRREDFVAVRDRAETLARQVLHEVGYTDAASGIDPDTCEVQLRFNNQSSHINQGVDRADGEIGTGDQSLMFG